MELKFLTIILAGFFAGLAYAQSPDIGEPSAAGMWEQVYPDGRVGGWFLIFQNGGLYQGAIAKMFLKPGEDPNSICTHCTGDQKISPRSVLSSSRACSVTALSIRTAPSSTRATVAFIRQK